MIIIIIIIIIISSSIKLESKSYYIIIHDYINYKFTEEKKLSSDRVVYATRTENYMWIEESEPDMYKSRFHKNITIDLIDRIKGHHFFFFGFVVDENLYSLHCYLFVKVDDNYHIMSFGTYVGIHVCQSQVQWVLSFKF